MSNRRNFKLDNESAPLYNGSVKQDRLTTKMDGLNIQTAANGWDLCWQPARAKMRIDSLLTAVVLVMTLCCSCKPTARDYRFTAREKYARGDYTGVIADYTEVLRLKPGDEEAFIFRGIARAHIGDLDGGIADCTSALRLHP